MAAQIKAGKWGEQTWNADHCVKPTADVAEAITTPGQPPSGGGLLKTVYRDYRRYRATGARNALSVIALTQGFWASAVFRLSHWALVHFRLPGLRAVANAVCVLLQKFIEVTTGISIPAGCNIGRGLYIGHFGG